MDILQIPHIFYHTYIFIMLQHVRQRKRKRKRKTNIKTIRHEINSFYCIIQQKFEYQSTQMNIYNVYKVKNELGYYHLIVRLQNRNQKKKKKLNKLNLKKQRKKHFQSHTPPTTFFVLLFSFFQSHIFILYCSGHYIFQNTE